MLWIPTVVLAVGAVTPRLQELQPKTYSSPSGRWTLRVEPTERSGTTEADDTLIGGEREAWHARHPFALWDAIVTDDGRVAGVAYSGQGPKFWSGGTLRVVVLAPTGEVLLDEAHERVASHFEHAAGWPRHLGLFAQPELCRFVVRVSAEDVHESGSAEWQEEWWSYALASGKPGERERPKEKLGLTSPFISLYAARPIPGTPLVLLHWPKDEWEKTPREHGALFQLVDPSWQVAWSLSWPHDYDAADSEARMRIQDEVRQEGGAILATGPRRFELRQVAEKRRVTFEVEPSDAAATRWSVKEASSTAFSDGATPPPPRELPARTLELVKRVPLGPARAPGEEIRDIRAFDFDERSHLRFVRGEEGTSAVTLVRLDETGTVLHATRAAPAEEKARLAWFALSRERWIAAADADGERPTARLWLVAESDGKANELLGFTGQRVQRVAALGDDAFLVLGTWQSTFSLDKALVALDSSGRVLWRYPETPGEVGFVEDVAVTTDGRIVALQTIPKTLLILSPTGASLETVELAHAFGHEPRYPCVVGPDSDGGVLVYDSSGQPPLHRTGLDGTLRASFDVRRADGTVLDECRNAVHVAPDGRMWTTDRHEFLRLGEDGRVDLELGPAERAELLEDPGFAGIDSRAGRLLVHDRRTRTVHVFDAEGRRVTLCRPEAEEREDLAFPMEIVVAPEGSILVADTFGSGYVRFDVEGKCHGARSLKAANVAFAPSGREYWGVGTEGRLERHDADGKRVAQVDKLPDGRWFRSIEDIAVAADGSLAVLDGPASEGRGKRSGDTCVALFGPGGEPVRVFSLPPGVKPEFVTYADGRVLLAGWKEAWLLDVHDGTVTALTLAEEASAFGLSPDGSELWAIAKDGRSFARYRLD
jgi:sugar lactone lactonase YvrE